MNYFENMLQILWLCVIQLVQTQPVLFGFTLLAGVVLAALVGGSFASVQPSTYGGRSGPVRGCCTVDPGLLRALCKSEIHSTDCPAGNRGLGPKTWVPAGEREYQLLRDQGNGSGRLYEILRRL